MAKKKKQTEFERDFPHWNICSPCATSKGGKRNEMPGICKYCRKQTVLIPICDFSWPVKDGVFSALQK